MLASFYSSQICLGFLEGLLHKRSLEDMQHHEEQIEATVFNELWLEL